MHQSSPFHDSDRRTAAGQPPTTNDENFQMLAQPPELSTRSTQEQRPEFQFGGMSRHFAHLRVHRCVVLYISAQIRRCVKLHQYAAAVKYQASDSESQDVPDHPSCPSNPEPRHFERSAGTIGFLSFAAHRRTLLHSGSADI